MNDQDKANAVYHAMDGKWERVLERAAHALIQFPPPRGITWTRGTPGYEAIEALEEIKKIAEQALGRE